MKNQIERINEFLDSVGIDAELSAQSGMVSLTGGEGGLITLEDGVNSPCVNKEDCKGTANVSCVNHRLQCNGSVNNSCMISGGGGEMNQAAGCNK